MKHIEMFKSLILVLLLGFSAIAASGIPVPDIPKGKGDRCVEPIDKMRTNHMEYILHQRDETMQKGIRTKKYSLKECVSCHAVRDENNIPVTYKDKRHFCNSCHEYASVQIDCFECHSSTPNIKNSSLPNKPENFFSNAFRGELNPQMGASHE